MAKTKNNKGNRNPASQDSEGSKKKRKKETLSNPHGDKGNAKKKAKLHTQQISPNFSFLRNSGSNSGGTPASSQSGNGTKSAHGTPLPTALFSPDQGSTQMQTNAHTSDSTNAPGTNLSELTTASQSWILCEKNHKTAVEQESDLQRFVKNTSFANLKMITNSEMMFCNPNEKSFCQLTCAKMHVAPDCKQKWWNSNVRVINKAINDRKSDVTQAMKKEFMGES